MYEFKVLDVNKDDCKKEGWVISDYTDIMKEIGLDKIAIIKPTHDIKEQDMRDTILFIENSYPNIVIHAQSIISTEKYPPEKYEMIGSDILRNRKTHRRVNIDRELARISKLLVSFDFLNFDKYSELQWSIPHIYNNESGRKILEYIKKLQRKEVDTELQSK